MILKPSKRPEKEKALLEIIRLAIRNGNYRDTRHSVQRAEERGIILPDILDVLEKGFHEKRKDQYKEDFKCWNYAIRGKTFDGEDLRIAVYLKGEVLFIATVIRMNGPNKEK